MKIQNITAEVYKARWDGQDYAFEPGQVVDIRPQMAHVLVKMNSGALAFVRDDNVEVVAEPTEEIVAVPDERTPAGETGPDNPETIPTEEVKEVPVVDATEDNPPAAFTCDVCGFVAKNESGLKAHIRGKHTPK